MTVGCVTYSPNFRTHLFNECVTGCKSYVSSFDYHEFKTTKPAFNYTFLSNNE